MFRPSRKRYIEVVLQDFDQRRLSKVRCLADLEEHNRKRRIAEAEAGERYDRMEADGTLDRIEVQLFTEWMEAPAYGHEGREE